MFERFRRHRACASQHFRLELKVRGSWLASPASGMVFARQAFLVHFLVVIGRWRFGRRRETAARLCRSRWWRPVDQKSLVQLHSPVPISYQGCGCISFSAQAAPSAARYGRLPQEPACHRCETCRIPWRSCSGVASAVTSFHCHSCCQHPW